MDIPGLIIIAGLQGGGKSLVIKYIMYENRKKFDWGLVFSHTTFSANNFDYLDKKFAHKSFNEAALVNLKNMHEKLVAAGKKPSGFIIFDDCLDKSRWSSPDFCSLLLELRHYGITCIISCQYPYLIPPAVRSQVFQVIMFEMEGVRAIRALYDSYGQRFKNFNEYPFSLVI